jgi:hypothetical protein
MERRNEKAKTGTELEEEKPKTEQPQHVISPI